MNILLTHGYFIGDDPVEARIMKPYPPLGLLFLSAWLKRSGIPAGIFDSTFSNSGELRNSIMQPGIGAVGIYVTLMTRSKALDMISFIKGDHAQRDVKVIIGGPDVRHYAANYLESGADFVIPGEGEETLTELIRMLDNGDQRNIQEIKGLFYRENGGKPVFTGERKHMDLAGLPFPSYENIDVSHYLDVWKRKHGYTSMTINTMRGCPYSCNWCSKSVFGNTYRRRNPWSVAEEMSWLAETFHPDQLWFTDDVFTINKTWLKDLTEEIAKRGLDLPYECITRSDCLDGDIPEMLKKSGCRKVWIGAESGSQKVIDLMNRRIDMDKTVEMMIRLKSLGISVGTFIMQGYHGETKKDIFQTAKFLVKTLPDAMTIGLAYPIKGTKYYETVEPLFEGPYDWKSGNERQIRYKKPYSGKFYRFSGRYLFNLLAGRKEKSLTKKMIFFLKAYISKIYMLIFN